MTDGVAVLFGAVGPVVAIPAVLVPVTRAQGAALRREIEGAGGACAARSTRYALTWAKRRDNSRAERSHGRALRARRPLAAAGERRAVESRRASGGFQRGPIRLCTLRFRRHPAGRSQTKGFAVVDDILQVIGQSPLDVSAAFYFGK